MKRLILFFLALLLPFSASAQTSSARMLSGVNQVAATSYVFVPRDATRLTAFTSATAIAASLPSGLAQGFGAQTLFSVQNVGGGTLTITCVACLIYSSNAGGSATLALAGGQGADLYGDGLNYWAFLGGSGGGGGGGSGTVNLGVAAQATYYAASANAVSPTPDLTFPGAGQVNVALKLQVGASTSVCGTSFGCFGLKLRSGVFSPTAGEAGLGFLSDGMHCSVNASADFVCSLPAGVAAGSKLKTNGVNGAYITQAEPVIDVRDSISAQPGAACDGITDDTAAVQRAINAACTFSTTPKKLAFPNGCALKITSTLTVTHCGGITLDGGQSQGQTSLSGATGGPATLLWYGTPGTPAVLTINQTRDSTFKNLSIFTNASAPASSGANNGILIDEIAPVTGIVTNNKFEDIQVYNGNSNSAFIGINICPTAPGNCEAQNFTRLLVNCATAAPTSSNNGVGIQYGAASGSAEPFYEYIHWIEPKHCSQAIVAQSSTAILDIDGGLMDLDYTDFFLNGTQEVSYRHTRSENATAPIVVGTAGSSPNSDWTIEENQFAGQPNSTTTISYPFATTGGIVRLIKNRWDVNATVTPMGPSGGGGFVGTVDSQDNTYPNATLCPAFTSAGSTFIGHLDGPVNGPCPYGGLQLTGSNGRSFTSGMLNGLVVASGTAALGTGIINSGLCATVVTVAANGVSLASGFAINNAGTGGTYNVGDILQLNGGGGVAGGDVKVTAVSGSTVTQVVTIALIPGTASTNIPTINLTSSGTGATLDTVGDNILWNFTGDPTGITGYAPAAGGVLRIVSYPTANNVNFKVCNDTAGNITPSAAKLNWRVPR